MPKPKRRSGQLRLNNKYSPHRERVVWEVPGIVARDIERLKEDFPQVLVEGKIDFEKLRTTLGQAIDKSPDRFTFSWAGKRNAVQILQMPTRATLIPVRGESINFDTTQNAFIEGDNLEVLKLLYKSYFGRVKMIYIDPPYNTGNDFVYPDNFADPLDTYLRISGQRSTEGNLLISNPETSGRFHSSWLTMMYPRLFLARQLLSDDGAIFVSIDDHEVHNLREIMNEVFGEENFVATIVWQRRSTPENRKVFSVAHDYILLYAKQAEIFTLTRNLLPMTQEALDRYRNPDNDPRGPWLSVPAIAQTGHATPAQFYTLKTPSGKLLDPPTGCCWRYTKDKMFKEIEANNIWFGQKGDGVPRIKKFLSEGRQGLTPSTIWRPEEADTNEIGRKELIELFNGKNVFDAPKPVRLVENMLKIATQKDSSDIVLDFFAGSCTTAHAVMKLNADDGGNRRFVMVQLPEPTPLESDARKAGFVTIAEIGKERIRLASKAIEQKGTAKLLGGKPTEQDLSFMVFKLAESNHKPWKGVEERTPERYAGEMREHIDSLVKGWKEENVIYEVAVKEGFGLNSRIEPMKELKTKKTWRVSDPESDLSFLICLDDSIEPSVLKNLNLTKETLFVCRESAINDTVAANLALQCRLKTI